MIDSIVMDTPDREFMEMAIEAARKSRGKPTDPRVGAVATLDGRLLGTAWRGQFNLGEHAEYTLLQTHLKDVHIAGATVYTTLEPCTKRNLPKIPCVERLIQRKVGRVVIGMLDPNPLVSGLGYRTLRQVNITTELFPQDLMSKLEELNCQFIRAIETDAIHSATKEIAELAKRSGTPRQQEAAGATLRQCLDSLRRINRGVIRIAGREAGYFKRFLERLELVQGTEHVKAYIRLTAFQPEELARNSWFENFYAKLNDVVRSKKLEIEYIFLLNTNEPTASARDFIDRYKAFAHRIQVVSLHDPRLTPELLHPSIVLWENQRFAFTHDRGEDGSLLEAEEWIHEDDFNRLNDHYGRIEVVSSLYYSRE